MRLSRNNKWLVLLGLILLVIAVVFSRVQLDRRFSVIVGLVEVTVAGLIGVLLGVSVARDRE
jgi:hypothetical protein